MMCSEFRAGKSKKMGTEGLRNATYLTDFLLDLIILETFLDQGYQSMSLDALSER